MEKYVFNEYDEIYPQLFELERKKLLKILNGAIEHVGSTAVPGLGGKGIIDIAIGVKELQQSKKTLELKYEWRSHASTPDRFFFKKVYSDRMVHIHLTLQESKDWCEMIGFRDYLRSHPKVVQQYAALKKEAVEKAQGDGKVYRAHKEKFIQEICNQL